MATLTVLMKLDRLDFRGADKTSRTNEQLVRLGGYPMAGYPFKGFCQAP